MLCMGTPCSDAPRRMRHRQHVLTVLDDRGLQEGSHAEHGNQDYYTEPTNDMIDIEPGFQYLRAVRSETTELILVLQNKA